MKISIITVCFNSASTIEETINSVLEQDYLDIEYIVIDGGSTDRTMDIVSSYQRKIAAVISEKDGGMYDAINKGIRLSTGQVVGILNSDDTFAHENIISEIAMQFKQRNTDCLIGNICFLSKTRIIREYSSQSWHPDKFVQGFMPPHPSFYCKRVHYMKYGLYRTDFEVAADYELMIRFLKINGLSYTYLNKTIVNMKLGGKSTRGLKSLITINREIKRACAINGLKTSYVKLYLKYFKKVFEFRV